MAKTWCVGEATRAIVKGDKEAILDIGSRYPLFTASIAAGVRYDNAAIMAVLEAIPERVSVRVIEAALKSGVTETDGEPDEAEDVPAEKAAPKKTAAAPAAKAPTKETKKAAPAKSDDDYDSMGAYKLYCLCKERGLDVKSKQEKEIYIDALRADDGGEIDTDGEVEADEEETASKYEGMKASELYKECKERGIDCEQRKPAEYYIELLEADDADGEDAEEDWDEKETKKAPAKSEKKAAAPAPAKTEKKAAPAPKAAESKKPADKPADKKATDKKPAKKDDDWDI